MVRPGKDPKEVESLISEEIAKLHSEPVTAKELNRARLGLKRSMAMRESALMRAQMLADATALYNDPNRVNTEIEKQLAVNPADIQKAVRAHLTNANRVVVDTAPAARAGARPQGKRPGGQED